MRVTYYTQDEVNRFLVRRWVGRVGTRVHCPDGPALASAAVGPMILDLDFLPAETRADWVQRLAAGELCGPTLVHGHNVTDGEASALRKAGVRVCRGRVRKAALCGWLDTVAAVVPA